ncbi:unannotated protein [freshwater metagenome]|uniref:Unannotated protein n=1 Tax=freshwater metagenome TaxID=449393 RepID=A0A6J6DA95_9ZZZZ|nr:WYL domain-containing protein [Actinomycetota bacterium]
MSAEKTERLINLTLGLLSTTKYLTKAEIFANIAGYGGSAETKERMFERDKDELRNMGIPIEVGGLDPLFEDEQGYRIRSADIQIQADEFSSEELLFMTMAANIWKESALSTISNNALMKVASIDSEIGFSQEALPMINDSFDSNQISILIEAISEKREISFKYHHKQRSLQPYGLKSLHGDWYLIGREQAEIKIFKLKRFESKIDLSNKTDAFEKPSDFNLNHYLPNDHRENMLPAILRVRNGKANILRSLGSVSNFDAEWDTLNIDYEDKIEFVKKILWFGTDVIVVSPLEIKNEVISQLSKSSNG